MSWTSIKLMIESYCTRKLLFSMYLDNYFSNGTLDSKTRSFCHLFEGKVFSSDLKLYRKLRSESIVSLAELTSLITDSGRH